MYNSEVIKKKTMKISLPEETLEDLRRIALFNELTVDELLASYISKSIAEDSRIARRVEFEQHRCSNNPHRKCRANIAEEIWNNSNLMY